MNLKDGIEQNKKTGSETQNKTSGIENKNYPFCFGILETVFPKGENGLRFSPETCLMCIYKTECLKTAMQGKSGISVKEEVVDRAYDSGMLGFFERWSRKKALKRMMKK